MIISFYGTLSNNTIGPWCWQFDPDTIVQFYFKDTKSQGIMQFKLVIERLDADPVTVTFATEWDRQVSYDALFGMLTMPPLLPKNKFYEKERKDTISQAMVGKKKVTEKYE